MKITPEHLRAIGDLTARITELKLQQCPHLCVDNFAASLFERLLATATKTKDEELDPQFVARFLGEFR